MGVKTTQCTPIPLPYCISAQTTAIREYIGRGLQFCAVVSESIEWFTVRRNGFLAACGLARTTSPPPSPVMTGNTQEDNEKKETAWQLADGKEGGGGGAKSYDGEKA